MSTRAAIYCRVSTEGQEQDGTSLDTQLERNRAYADQCGYAVVMVEQEQESGMILERPGLQRIRDAIRDGAVDVLVVYDLDRLSRHDYHPAILFNEIENHHGGRVESVTQPGTGQELKLKRWFASMLNSAEVEKTKERTMRGEKAFLDEGNVPTFTFAAYGYELVKYDKETRKRDKVHSHRRVVEHEAEHVRWLYEAVASGWSLEQACLDLNARGVPAPGKARGLKFKDGRSVRWLPGTASRIVSNPCYRGDTYANMWKRIERYSAKTGRTKPRVVPRPQDEWWLLDDTGTLTPAIVSRDLWDRANERMVSNRGDRTRNADRPTLLRGRCFCAACRRPAYIAHDARRPHVPSVYKCRTQSPLRFPDAVPYPVRVSVRQDELDEFVWDEVLRLLQEREAVVAEIRKRVEGQRVAPDTAERERLQAREAELARTAQALVDAFAETAGTVPWSTFAPRVEKVEKEREAIRRVLARLDSQQQVAVSSERIDSLVERLGPVLSGDVPFETRAQVLAELDVQVVVTPVYAELTWALPLVEQSGWAGQVDLTKAEEPDEGTREQVEREAREEALRGTASELSARSTLPPASRSRWRRSRSGRSATRSASRAHSGHWAWSALLDWCSARSSTGRFQPGPRPARRRSGCSDGLESIEGRLVPLAESPGPSGSARIYTRKEDATDGDR